MSRNRGKKTREKRDLLTRELSLEERSAMLDALLKPPIAISYGIIGALTVEHELELLIKSRLRKISQKEWEAILSDKEGPLGSFDRKIKFANYLGLLDEQIRANLDIIRNVRNRFAHTKRLISFDHSIIADELAKMAFPRGQKRKLAPTASFDPQWKYISLCLHSVGIMSKKRHGARTAAHKAWMRRHNAKNQNFGGILGLLNKPSVSLKNLALPESTPLLLHSKKASSPTTPTPLGLWAGLFGDEADNPYKPGQKK
ncbi:hypothetical protein [Bradyrhizobium icense]|nr:hypothetical protein [Bradyrhizobium icense]